MASGSAPLAAPKRRHMPTQAKKAQTHRNSLKATTIQRSSRITSSRRRSLRLQGADPTQTTPDSFQLAKKPKRSREEDEAPLSRVSPGPFPKRKRTSIAPFSETINKARLDCWRDNGAWPTQGAKAKAQSPVRRSARLNSGCSEHTKRKKSLLANKTLCKEDRLTASLSEDRKRLRQVENLSDDHLTAPYRKRPRTSPVGQPSDRETPFCGRSTQIDPIDYWRKKQTWPREYFKPDAMLVQRKSTSSLRRKRSDSGSIAADSSTPSDQKPREEKAAQYQDQRYKTLLETKGSFMRNYVGTNEKGIEEDSKRLCQTLLETEQNIPRASPFDDDIFSKTCDMIDGRNEAKVIQDIGRLLVPSAQALATRNAKLECLIESVNEGWNYAIPLTGTRPQPDYSVGFKREAFTKDQLDKLLPSISDFIAGYQSSFMATYYMYFPFLTCEVKCGAVALDVADRQNAHSMTLAVRAIVELFQLVKREQELHRQILAFSISHDHRSVRIYGHYPVIDGSQTTFYRHPIHEFSFTALDGKEKWTAYRFTKNVYDVWMPMHLDRIRSIINELPSDSDFEVPPLPEESGLSQELERGCRSGTVHVGNVTPDSSTRQGAPKKPRKNTVKSKR